MSVPVTMADLGSGVRVRHVHWLCTGTVKVAGGVTIGIPERELAAWYEVDDSHISRICSKKDKRASRPRAVKGEAA